MSFLVADLKYNGEVKICEIQDGRKSKFSGYDDANGIRGEFAKLICDVLMKYHDNFWFIPKEFNDKYLVQECLERGWIPTYPTMEFSPLDDLTNIYEYFGVLFTSKPQPENPGVIQMDRSMISFGNDKSKMNRLFDDEELKQYRPRWGIYPKKYHKALADQIISDLDTDTDIVVIKPLNGTKGRGVIIIEKNDLDRVLNLIIKHKKKAGEIKDRSYNYWARDKNDYFIVEEFIASDPVMVHNKPYDATMRVVFLLAYNQQNIELTFIGAYWKLPEKSLWDEGHLNQQHKSCGKDGYYEKVDDDLYIEVSHLLKNVLPIMYMKMLEKINPI